MRKTVVIVVLALIPVSFAQAQIPASEREALIAFYNSTDGDHWSNTTDKWKKAGGIDFRDPGTECGWYGVTCSIVYDQVLLLQLDNNNLSGTIPPEIGNLSMLVYLYLSDNQLTGSIPPELENAPHLQQIWLQGNQLSGSIPAELGNLSSLIKLVLARNQLTESIPPQLGNLSSLLYLHLGENQLSGSIPPELGDLTSLSTGLSLNGNQLTGSIPPELGKLTNLRLLHLDSNQLSGGIPPQLGNLASLWQLWLHDNQLSGAIPPQLADLPVVEQMHLYSNQLSGSIPPEFGNMTAPVDLGLNDNRLSGSIPPELGNMTAVLGLNLASNQLSGEIPSELMGLSTLTFLDLWYNALHSENPTLISFLNSTPPGSGWQMTQTIAPTGLAVLSDAFFSVGDHTIWLNWIPIDYQMDPGGYEVFSSPTGFGFWTSGGWNENKVAFIFPVTGLAPGTTYDLAVASYTDPHAFNQNLLISGLSTPITPTTASTGCGQPVIEKSGTGPFTLTLTESYNDYQWNTGETTASINVDPLSEQWIWVRVLSGPCNEAAVISVAPIVPLVFSDGFESGDTTEWSSSVP